MTLYVNDGLLAATYVCLIEVFLFELRKHFKITETHKVSIGVSGFLGIRIFKLLDRSIFINQKKYVKKVLESFKMSNTLTLSLLRSILAGNQPV